MPISPNYKPALPEYTSQFVQQQQPYDLMLRAGEQRQSQIDEVRDLAAETRGKLTIDSDPRLTASYAIAKQREKQYMDELEKDMEEFYETGNVRRAARKLSSLSNQWQKDFIKKGIEQQSQRLRKDMETYREMVQKGKQPINKWMQNGQYVSGVTSSGLYMPLTGVIEGIKNEEIRKMFEEKMDIEKTKTITKQGKKINYRAKEDMFDQVGLNQQGRLTGQASENFNQWVNDIGRDRLINYMQRTGIVKSDSSVDDIDTAARRLYERTAREVAQRYEDYDITSQLEGYEDDVTPFGKQGTFATGETYNYRLPGFEKVIGANVLTRLENVEGEAQRNMVVNDIKEQITGQKEMSDALSTVMAIQNDLTKKGIFDPDAESYFRLNPDKYNYGRLKDILDKAARGISISEEEASIAKDLIGPNIGLGKRQTVNEIQDELVYTQQKETRGQSNLAKKALDEIAKVEGRHYQEKIKESKAKAIKNPQGWGIPYKEQSRIANLNFGRTEVIDATKGVQVTGDYIDRDDLKPRRIVSLPLVKVDGRWVDFTENEEIKEKVSPDRLTNKLFIEAAGKIDPTNLEPESRLQMFAASQEDISEKTPIDAQFEEKQDKILKSDKMLIYVNDAMKQQILGSVESNAMQELFQNYQVESSEQAFGPSDVQSENL